jgi:hypothetical protein
MNHGYPLDAVQDFLTIKHIAPDTSIVGNPPFADEIAQHAIALNPIKMALIWPLARVVAAWPWLAEAPLARVWMLTPRPAIPPGSYLAAGKKPEEVPASNSAGCCSSAGTSGCLNLAGCFATGTGNEVPRN